MKCALLLLILFVFVGCNSKEAALGSIQGIRDPNNPVPYITNVLPQGGGTYAIASGLDFYVTYSEPVLVEGNPRIHIIADSGSYYANYVSGSGTNILYFQFVVPSGAFDYNGIQLSGIMNLNGGSIYDPDDDDDSALRYTLPSTATVLLNGIDPVITSITIDNGTYTLGEDLEFTVNYTYPVYVTGTPHLKLGIAATVPDADYVSGSGTTALKFRITVPTEEDYDGIPVYSPLDVAGASLVDYFGDAANSTFINTSFMNVIVDGVAPSENQRNAPTNGLRTANMHLDYSIGFHEIINVSGTPRIPVVIGGTTKYANYIAGSGGSTLYFRYTIVAGDLDTDGITSATSIQLNGGSIVDRAGNPYNGIPLAWPVHSVNVGAPPATEQAKTIPANGTYIKGNVLEFKYNYDKIVNVTGGTPHLTIRMDGVNKTVAFDPTSSGTTSLRFTYTIVENDWEMNGVQFIGISYNAATIRDVDNNTLTLTAFPSLTGINVDGDSPVITSVTQAGGNYKIGASVDFVVHYDDTVLVTGNPTMQLTLGITPKTATYVSGSGSGNLTFRYVVDEGTSDNNGIENTSPLSLSGGTIKDAFGNNAFLSYTNGLYATTLVDAVRPVFTSSAPSPTVLRPGNNVYFTLTASENIVIAGGVPTMSLEVGSSTFGIPKSGNTANSITFHYLVGAEMDLDGINYTTNAITLPGGVTIRDSFGNDATLSFSAPNMSKVYVLPDEIKYWFDASDTATTTSATSATSFKSKANTITPAVGTGGDPVLNPGPNGTKFAKFNGSTNYFTATFSDADVVIVTLKTPTSSGSVWLNQSTGNHKINFDYSGPPTMYGGTACIVFCEFYKPVAQMFTMGAAGEWSPYAFTAGTYRTLAVDFKNPGSGITYRIGQFNGEIGEMFILSSGTLIPTSLIQDIGAYLNARHGATW
jgi:hypothetical protein